MTSRRFALYILLNIVVSAAVTFTALWLWDKTHPYAPPTANVIAGSTAAPAVGTQPTPVVGDPPAGATRAPAQAPTPTMYVVQSGDTLGAIANQFDVPLEDLMQANGLTNPDVLSPGQTLLIPIGGLATEAPAETLAPTLPPEPPRATATRDPNAPPPRLALREVRAPGTLAEETIVIVNEGGPVNLSGWTIRDESGRQYTFPALTLFENGAVNLHTTLGNDTVTDLYWKQTAAVWASGKEVQLNDAEGNLHARLVVP